uniref:3-phosphoserine/phosphohydroxythreonine transaminase n=1 Tax=uncultured Flavobacterium sp. TaxID=165435 RepID=UPI002594730F
MKKHNYSAGPCILPQEVFEKSAQAILDFNNSGLSILEISHRSKDFVAVMDEARALVLELLGLEGKGYQALFLSGGASLEFLMVPYNLMKVDGKAAYLDTGTWANSAIKEAKHFGETVVVASSKPDNYNHIPKEYTIPADASYFHCTSNNTIFGTQMKSFPETNVPLVCDMSSDIFSRKLDFSQFDLIYAGAQKNMGPAGVTLVVVKEEILGKTGRTIPNMLNYQQHIAKESMYNTPPVFPTYVSLLTLQWLKKLGGIEAIEKNITKYTPANGTIELRKRIAEKVKKEIGLEYTPNQVTVGSGAKFIIFAALQMICNPGDEVIIHSPYWVSYPTMVELADGVPHIVNCDEKEGFKLTPEKLEK